MVTFIAPTVGGCRQQTKPKTRFCCAKEREAFIPPPAEPEIVEKDRDDW
jgi:hypothetical protein